MNGRIWNEEEIAFLKENYDKMTFRELGEKLNRTRNSVELKSNRLNLKCPKIHNYDTNKFKHINNEEDAYWFGFLYADCGVSYLPERRNYELNLELQSIDKTHIKKFIKYMNLELEIKDRKRKKLETGKVYSSSLVRIYSKEILDNLISLGFSADKRKESFNFPEMECSLKKHFLRGFFDGDGSIYWYKKRECYHGNITCQSEIFLNDVRTFLKNNRILSYVSSFVHKPSGKRIYQLNIKGKRNAINFFNFIYGSSTIYLDRKYLKYVDCLSKQ